MTLTSNGVLWAAPPYLGHMRHTGDQSQDTWGASVRRNRVRLQKTQDELAKALRVALKTISRWENRNARPESYDTAVAAIKFLGMDHDEGLRLAGFGPREPDATIPDPYAHVREMGLDPMNVVVQRILQMPAISDELRESMLRRERRLQAEDEQRRLRDLEWWEQEQRRREWEDPEEDAG